MNNGHYAKQLTKEHSYKLVYFNAKVLNDFIQDPRYILNNFRFKCNISIKEEFDNDNNVSTENKIILDNIGFGYDENNMRIVAVFLKNLSVLHYKMQNRFYTYEITNKNTFLDPMFINSINGKWNNKTSIFQAIYYEMEQINKICESDKKFFKNNFKSNNPKEFNIIILPTKSEYNSFITTFDKLLSDNINKNYFNEKIDLIEINNNKKIHKNTIRLLKEWLEKINVKSEIIDKIITPIKNIREQRNKSSHSIYDDKYDINFIIKQTEILTEVYYSLKYLLKELIKYYEIKTPSFDEWFINDKFSLHSLGEIKNKNNENYQMIENNLG